MSLVSLNNIAKMSAAGSGKTYDICKNALEQARSGKRVLITTYTNRGAESVRNEIRLQNDGVLHPLVIVKTWYVFMLSELIKPYQRYLTQRVGGVKGFDYSQSYGCINYAKAGTIRRYLTDSKNVRSNEGASLACLLNSLSNGKVITRLEMVYSTIFFDEIQDMVGDDLEIIRLLINSSIGVVFCGDNKQATFSTHNTKKNKGKTGKNIWQFFSEMEKNGSVIVERNLSSRRFNQQICCFANSIFPVGEPITTIMTDKTGHDGVFLIEVSGVSAYLAAFSPQVLRYDKTFDSYGRFAVNFGACKGETYDRILIVPNGPLTDFVMKGIALSSPEKYYVAVTRPKYSIAIAFKKLPKALSGYEETLIECGNTSIRALKYIIAD